MLAPRGILRKFRWRRLICIIIAGLFIALVLSISLKPNITDFLQLHKCPACYGVSLCNDILQGPAEISILFDFWGRLGLLANAVVTKNVFSGRLDHRKVIIKRLGHDSELHHMDELICEAMGEKRNCEMKEVIFKLPNLRESVKKLLNATDDLNNYRLRLCPSLEHVDDLFSPLLPRTNGLNSARLDNDGYTANIWTLLHINPEPLLYQILRAEDGWPVARYLGACGRIAVMLNEGDPLTSFISRSWPERAGLALQLLLAADRFTYFHPHFAFYLLDVSADNIVVNEKGKLSFVDLEHVIIVDRHPSGALGTWNESHTSESLGDCLGCSTFSPADICNHHTSDHNHFMICQLLDSTENVENFMPGGLLHSTSTQIQSQYPRMKTFLQECSSPKGTDRIRSARRLRDLLSIASKENPLFGDQALMQTWKYF